MRGGIINEKCITEPMKWLNSERFRVFVIHIKKKKKKILHWIWKMR